MPNIAAVLKAEISRVARKEARAETEALKKTSVNQRAEIAGLKRRVQELEKLLKTFGRTSARTALQAPEEVLAEIEAKPEGASLSC